MRHERAGNFLPMPFLFFFGIHFSNSGERAEARAYAVFTSDLLLRNDPVTHLRPLLQDLCREGRQQRYRLDLNQDLNKFRGRNERRESNWDLDSRNVPYGIFRATPKKRAK
jgi:hypothetical protein